MKLANYAAALIAAVEQLKTRGADLASSNAKLSLDNASLKQQLAASQKALASNEASVANANAAITAAEDEARAAQQNATQASDALFELHVTADEAAHDLLNAIESESKPDEKPKAEAPGKTSGDGAKTDAAGSTENQPSAPAKPSPVKAEPKAEHAKEKPVEHKADSKK